MKPLSLLSAFLAAACSLHAAVVISDTFDAYEPGVLPGGGANPAWSSVTDTRGDNGEAIFTRVDVDTADHFGSGTANQYLRLQAKATTTSIWHSVSTKTTDIGTSGQVSFSFYEPVTDNAAGSGFLLRLGRSAASNDTSAFGIAFQQGGLYASAGGSLNPQASPFATYSQATAHTFTLVFNNSDASVAYDGGRILSSNTMDIWLDGVLVKSGQAKAGGLASGVVINGINFTAKTGAIAELHLDNLVIDSAITISSIPEPGVAALFAGTLAGLAALFRLRSSRRPAFQS